MSNKNQKFAISSGELTKNLQFLSGVIPTSSTMPILDNFLFELSDKKLKITSCDLETTMSATLDVDFNGEVSICLPAKLLIEVLKTFSEQPLIFTIKDNSTIEISSNTGQYEIAYSDSEAYPTTAALDEAETINITSKVLHYGISKTIVACGSDDLRPVMNGVYFNLCPDGLFMVSTDAHKLVKYHNKNITAKESAQFIIPKKALNVLKAMIATIDQFIDIQYTGTNAVFTFGEYMIQCRLIDGKYPNYEAVIPKENPNRMVIDRASFLQSVKRVSTFSNKTTHQVKLRIVGNDLHISAEDVDYSNKADERLTCAYEGDDMSIGFNSKFLAEMLSNVQSENVMLEMSTPVRAGILTAVDASETDDDVLMLVMPVKID